MNPETLMIFGDVVKASDGGVIEGWLVRFNSPDTTPGRDWFDAKTDFDFEGKTVQRSCRFHHGLSVKAGKTKYGAITITRMEEGLYAHLKMDMTQPYAGDIHRLAKAGQLGWSSGSATHLVEKVKQPDDTTYIKSWPIIEGSLTPLPADPAARAFVKSLGELGLDDPLITPEDDPAVKSSETFYSARGVLYAICEALYLPKSLLNLPNVAQVLRDIAGKVEKGELDGFSDLPDEWGDYYSIKAGRRNSKKDQSSLNEAHAAIVKAGAECPSNMKSGESADVDPAELATLQSDVERLTAENADLQSQLKTATLLREDAEGQLATLLNVKG